MLLIAGGDLDPNIAALLRAAKRLRRPCIPLLVGKSRHPVFRWDLPGDRLFLDGRRIEPGSAFIRHDVFGHLDDERPEIAFRAYAWFSAVTAYVDAHPGIRCFNRKHDGGGTKPHQLHLAHSVGLKIPWTSVTNDVGRVRKERERRRLVTKPVNGGEYCQRLDDVLQRTSVKDRAAAAPAIVQEELVQPDVRIYRVSDRFFAFTIASAELDYRSTNDVRVTFNPHSDAELCRKLGRLTDALGLDYAAADFKADALTGELRFLEVNSAPMFVAFDNAANGALTRAMLDYLTVPGRRQKQEAPPPGKGPSPRAF